MNTQNSFSLLTDGRSIQTTTFRAGIFEKIQKDRPAADDHHHASFKHTTQPLLLSNVAADSFDDSADALDDAANSS